MRPNHGGMQKGGVCCSRYQEGCRDGVGLYPTDHAGHATTEGGHQAFASNRPAACGGLQGAEPEVRNGPRGEITTERIANDQTVGHVETRVSRSPRQARLANVCFGAKTGYRCFIRSWTCGAEILGMPQAKRARLISGAQSIRIYRGAGRTRRSRGRKR